MFPLLVVDRGNAALRQITLNKEDCDYQYGSVSTSDVAMFVGSLLVPSERSESETKEPSKGKHTPLVSTIKEETWWESFRQVFTELYKQALESVPSNLKSFLPSYQKKGLTPLKDTLKMPEDEIKTNVTLKQSTVTPLSETKHASLKHEKMKPPKMKSSSFKNNPSLLNKHGASFYGTGMVSSSHSRSKGQKDRSRHRQKEKGWNS
ncbi:hypothetical protein SDJN03_01263, partial [Cucurbita argyrosperma subsp. sororia]